LHTPDEIIAIKIERKQAIETRRSQEQGTLNAADLVAVLQKAIPIRAADTKATIVDKQLVTRRYKNPVTIELDAAQTTIGAAPFEVDLARVPVDVLKTFLPFKVDRKYAAMALALLTSAHDRRRNQLR
jgi:hypothetical protein